MHRLIAIDWGTTNRRIFVIDEQGKTVAHDSDRCGILAMHGADYSTSIAAIRNRFGDWPVIVAGMAGSNRGWTEVPYVACPASVDTLARSVCWIEPRRTALIPGVSVRSDRRADVMRGEEVQFLGATALQTAAGDARLCQPGTHCKWATMKAGAILDFATAMTGELFAVLKTHTILAAQMTGHVINGAAFRDGVADAREGDLLASFFRVRSDALLSIRPMTDSAAYLSGLIIGADVAARATGGPIGVVADPVLGDLYVTAIVANGGRAVLIDSHAAFTAGIDAIWRKL